MLTDKEKMELLNLRQRVKQQREEIKRLQDLVNKLQEEKTESECCL